MNFIDWIDPFLMQLFIVPVIVIGLGILVSIITKKVIIAPVVTLVCNLLYEAWYSKYHYPDLEISFTSWNIIFPIISWLISGIVVSIQKSKSKDN